MEANYNGHSNKSGIYQIRNLNNGKVYVGSAKGFKQRFTQHVSSLIKGTHHNKHLQSAFNQEGTDKFIFEVLEVVEGEQSDRLLVEQKHLDILLNDWEKCYNFKKETVASSRSCFSKDPEKTKRLRSESKQLYYSNPENRLKQSRLLKGRPGKPLSPEQKERLRVLPYTVASLLSPLG